MASRWSRLNGQSITQYDQASPDGNIFCNIEKQHQQGDPNPQKEPGSSRWIGKRHCGNSPPKNYRLNLFFPGREEDPDQEPVARHAGEYRHKDRGQQPSRMGQNSGEQHLEHKPLPEVQSGRVPEVIYSVFPLTRYLQQRVRFDDRE